MPCRTEKPSTRPGFSNLRRGRLTALTNIVNTDADQIIIAEAGPREAGGLPAINYMADGLEDAAVRERVCEIFDGGEHAFRERARRLRVRFRR